MILKDIIIQAIEQKLEKTDCFLIDVKVSPSNDIVVEIDSDTAVNLDFCADLARHIETVLDRDTEDFSLEVGSYGLTKPFAVVRQYEKNIGQNVEILTDFSKKIRGKLTEVLPDSFVVEIKIVVKVEGAKRKIEQIEAQKFYYDKIKYCKLSF